MRGGGEEHVAERVAEADAEHDRELPAARAGAPAGARRPPAATISGEVMRKSERRPVRVGLAGRVHRREVEAEADGGEQREPDAGGDAPLPARLVLLRGEDDADERAGDPRVLRRRRAGRRGAIPKTTGTIAEAPAIGATTAIAPIAMPR